MSALDMRDEICNQLGIQNDLRMNDKLFVQHINEFTELQFETIFDAWTFICSQEY